MLVDSDGELDKIFDDRLRVSKVIKNKGVLGDRTNRQQKSKQRDLKIEKENVPASLSQEMKERSLTKAMSPDFEFLLRNDNDKLYFSYDDKKGDRDDKKEEEGQNDKKEEDHHEALLDRINKDLEGLMIKHPSDEKDQTNNVRHGLVEDKLEKDGLRKSRLKKISANSSTQLYLSEIEKEFKKIRESHKKMLMTRNKVLKMVEKEIEIAKKEVERTKNKEIKNLERKIKELMTENEKLRVSNEKQQDLTGTFNSKQSSNKTKEVDTSDLVHNYETLEIKYSDKVKEVEILQADNSNLKKQLEAINEKYTNLKAICKESLLKYKENLDNLYLTSLRSIKKKYKR